MALDPKPSRRFQDTPRDRPQVERTEHANIERPGAQIHPRAGRSRAGWEAYLQPARTWRLA